MTASSASAMRSSARKRVAAQSAAAINPKITVIIGTVHDSLTDYETNIDDVATNDRVHQCQWHEHRERPKEAGPKSFRCLVEDRL